MAIAKALWQREDSNYIANRTCALVVEQRTHHQITGKPMKFLTLAYWTGMVETELFEQTYRSYGLASVRYPVLEVTARSSRSITGGDFRCAFCGRENRGRQANRLTVDATGADLRC